MAHHILVRLSALGLQSSSWIIPFFVQVQADVGESLQARVDLSFMALNSFEFNSSGGRFRNIFIINLATSVIITSRALTEC
jgi:hypothetical protein